MREIRTDKAPKAVGPYSQAVIAGGLVFVSGQIPIEPESGELIRSSLTAQAEQVFKNLKAVVEAAGSSLGDVVKVTLYLTDINRFAEVNEVYANFFNGDVLPARACVEVSALPKGVDIEADAIALLKAPSS